MSTKKTQQESKTKQAESEESGLLNGVDLEDKKRWSGHEMREAIGILRRRKIQFGLSFRSNRLLRWLESSYRARYRTPSSDYEHEVVEKAEEKRQRRRLRNLRNQMRQSQQG